MYQLLFSFLFSYNIKSITIRYTAVTNKYMNLLNRRYSTISDVGDSLYSDDLEWDKYDFTRHLSESDALSSYDINEMTEIFRYRFLEFDMSSSSLSNDEDLNIINNHNSIKTRLLHRSLSDFNFSKQENNEFYFSKHLSLINIKSIQWTFLKPHEIISIQNNSHPSICSIPQSMEIESDDQLSTTTTDNFLRLSKFSIMRLYLTKIGEKVSSLVSQTFQSTKPIVITEEIIETYDIIQE